jgi:hypothetical protein
MTEDLDPKALEAARTAWLESASDYTRLDVSIAAAIRAYLASLPAQADGAGEVVKALEWRDLRGDGSLAATTNIGLTYLASAIGWGYRNYPDKHPVTGGIEAAKAAAQADYETRILSALASPPLPSADVAGLLIRLDRGAMGSGVGPLDCREAAAALRLASPPAPLQEWQQAVPVPDLTDEMVVAAMEHVPGCDHDDMVSALEAALSVQSSGGRNGH